MSTKLIPALSALTLLMSGLQASAQDGAWYVGQVTAHVSASAGAAVQKPLYAAMPQNGGRGEVVSGARLTLFASFLRKEEGVVLLVIGETTHECQLLEWRPNSVTIDLPRLGVTGPKAALLHIVLPDGRIAKTLRVVIVPQPCCIQHRESIPRSTPPVHAGSAHYLN